MNEFPITEDFPENEIEFDERFADELDCYDYLFRAKWPDGFMCCICGHRQYWLSARALYICAQCEHQHSLTSGTILHGTRKPLRYWFKAMWWFTTRNSGINAINLCNLLGFGCYETAWAWLQKLRSCTIRYNREQLSGDVEVDEIYIGGRKKGKRGRGAEGKFPIVAAVENDGPELGRIRLQLLDNCSSDQIIPFIKLNISDGSQVATDCWPSYNPLSSTGYGHVKIMQSQEDEKSTVLPGVHLVASLLKRLMLGTFQGRFEKKYLQRYLDEFVFRFNRRTSKSIGKKFMRIVQQAVATPPTSHRQISQGVSAHQLCAN